MNCWKGGISIRPESRYDRFIRIKAAKSVDVFADVLMSRSAIRGAKRQRAARHHDATGGRRSSSIY